MSEQGEPRMIESKEHWNTGAPLASYWAAFTQWSANSQYGYPMAWLPTESEAVTWSRAYYTSRRELTAAEVA